MARKKKALIVTFSVIGGALILVILVLTVLQARLFSYQDPYVEKTFDAGFTEKTVDVNGVKLNYGEGPDNGPPLLLLHAQNVTWLSYAKVLPELSKSYHIFAPDCHGHGKSDRAPERYQANLIGEDLALFIRQVAGEPVYATGNSSGGILTAWLAANKPELIRSIVLEDAPLFTTEFPRIKETVAYETFRICNDFMESGESDYLLYWIRHNSLVVDSAGRKNLENLVNFIEKYRKKNPGRPTEVSFLPDMLRVSFRGMEQYDPRFGVAFYDGTWNTGLDHATMLAKIRCPALFIHANFYYEDGILMGALDDEDAAKVVSLIPDGRLVKVDSEHTVHLDKPEMFIEIITDFFGAR